MYKKQSHFNKKLGDYLYIIYMQQRKEIKGGFKHEHQKEKIKNKQKGYDGKIGKIYKESG